MKDYFQVLNLKKGASITEVKKAYRKLSMKYHPDRMYSETSKDETLNKALSINKFHDITEAYKILSNPKERAIYLNNISEVITNNPRKFVEEFWINIF